MSVICNTRYGLLRRVTGGMWQYLLTMPCGDLEPLSEAQYRGEVSIDHAHGCRSANPCAYHETHNLDKAVAFAGGWRTV